MPNTASLTFFQSADVPQLYAASDDGTPPPAGTSTRWFLLPPGATAKPQLALADSWAIAGTYLFLQTPVPAGGDAAFAAAAWRLLTVPSLTQPRAAWLAGGVPVLGAVQGYVLSVVPGGSTISRTLEIPYRNYALLVANGTALSLDMAAAALTLTQTAACPIAFTTDFGAVSLTGAGSIAIPFQGTNAGALQFPLTIGNTGGLSDLTHLDIGFRTYYATPDGGTPGATLVSSLAYPLLAPTEQPTLMATLAPWSVAEDQTFFAFAGATGALTSCYGTVTGHTVTLRPVQDGSGPSATPARLVLANRPSAIPPSPDDLYTIVPKGDFLVAPAQSVHAAPAASPPPAAVDASPPASRFMCGLSGVEYVSLAATSMVSFFTGAAAFVQGFDPDATTPAPTALTKDATTAWAQATGYASQTPTALTYYAQPEGAVLYQPSDGTTLAPLVYLEVPANQLPATVAATNAMPLLPYGGIASSDPQLAAYATLEKQVISPSRRALVAALGGLPPAAPTGAMKAPAAGADTRFGSATPQGLLALFNDTTLQTIDELVLAAMPDGSRFSLYNLPNGDPLRTAIASNQLFLVLSNPAAIAPYLSPDATKREIVIEDWTFALDSDQWAPANTPAALDTAVVFKFAQGRLVDLISNTGAWAQAQAAGGGPAKLPFNVSDAATSARLAAQIAAAIAHHDNGDTDFAAFVAAVTDPAWQGILFFNVTTPLTQIPDQCKGLAAGIDPSLFRAHHLAIDIAKIDTGTTPLSIKPSSMFGLINYTAPQIPISPNGAAYQFQVDSLKVLFLSSAIASFSSRIELMVRQLFGDSVQQPSDQSILVLYGALQHQTIAGQVYDTYLFTTAQNQPMLYQIVPGNVFNAVQVASAQFVTELQATGDALTHTYFALAGFMDFSELDLDVFSFGREASGTPAGLQYSRLMVRMVFNPAVQDSAVFTFDAGHTAFDTATSSARTNSLYNHFPLTLAGITQATSVATPGGAGYLGVQSSLTQSALSLPWFGLVFNLDLGSLGALAAKAGFIAQVIAAWSPSTGPYKVFVGLKLPGSDGGRGSISVEGVLNIGFRAIVLGRVDTANYFLLLNALAMKLLSVTFPPNGQIDMALFGNPVDQHNSSLGWYVAYTKNQDSKSGGAKDRQTQAALRRTMVRQLLGPRVEG